MGKSIYIVVTHQVDDYEDLGIQTWAFNKKKDAQKALAAFKKSELPYCKKEGWMIEPSDRNSFEAYEDGDYTRNHSIAHIQKVEVE